MTSTGTTPSTRNAIKGDLCWGGTNADGSISKMYCAYHMKMENLFSRFFVKRFRNKQKMMHRRMVRCKFFWLSRRGIGWSVIKPNKFGSLTIQKIITPASWFSRNPAVYPLTEMMIRLQLCTPTCGNSTLAQCWGQIVLFTFEIFKSTLVTNGLSPKLALGCCNPLALNLKDWHKLTINDRNKDLVSLTLQGN